MTPEERMARAEELADALQRYPPGVRRFEVAATLRGLVADLREARDELATLRAQVVSALSAAGPGEDERSA
jgi:hypothetical protein